MISKILRPRVLLIEKNLRISKILKSCSICHNISVERIKDVNNIPKALANKYSLLIVDLNLTQEKVTKALKEIREHNLLLPIIAIGPNNPIHEIASYRLGINSYHHKPINCELLKAQILHLTSFFQKKIILELGNIKIDLTNQTFTINKKKISFTFQEFHLIFLLIKSNGNTLNRNKICSCSYGNHKEISYAAIDTLVSRIRSKLRPYLKVPFIKTEYKLGYRIDPLYLKDSHIEKS